MKLPLPIATYRLPSPKASASRLVNCFIEQGAQGSAKGPVLLRRAPGIRTRVTLGDGPVRGVVVMAGTLYALSGQTLYAIDANWQATAATGSVPGSERVRIETNGTSIVIVRPSVGTGYSSDGATVSQITDSTFTGWTAGDVAFLDGYLVFRRPGTAQFFNTGLNALTFSALDIATAEGKPDILVGMTVDHREIFLAGTDSCELWYNAALPTGSPFARTPSGLLEIGCAAGASVGRQSNSVFWLADDLTIRRLNGSNPGRVSQHAIEDAIARMSVVSDAFAIPYRAGGHEFFALTFPQASRTFLFDSSTGEWHERKSYGLGRWRANCTVRAYQKQVIGDSTTGKLGTVDPEIFTEFDDPMTMLWTYQGIYAENRRASHRRFELVVNSGSGTSTGQGQNPLVTLKLSNDGGSTFHTMPTRSLGLIGQYEKRVAWHRLGSARDRVYQVEVSDPVPVFGIDTTIEGTDLRI